MDSSFQGVGKPVEYNVLLDEIGCTKDEVEGFLNSLCYTHQIVNSAISMPEPVYQADELAKRGRNNYITMKYVHQNTHHIHPYFLLTQYCFSGAWMNNWFHAKENTTLWIPMLLTTCSLIVTIRFSLGLVSRLDRSNLLIIRMLMLIPSKSISHYIC
jgi:hypothetical protein